MWTLLPHSWIPIPNPLLDKTKVYRPSAIQKPGTEDWFVPLFFLQGNSPAYLPASIRVQSEDNPIAHTGAIKEPKALSHWEVLALALCTYLSHYLMYTNTMGTTLTHVLVLTAVSIRDQNSLEHVWERAGEKIILHLPIAENIFLLLKDPELLHYRQQMQLEQPTTWGSFMIL